MSPEDEAVWKQATVGIKPIERKPVPPAPSPRGRIAIRAQQFSPFLDLHGFTVEGAFEATQRLVYEARVYGLRYVTVVTGKSGLICCEFPSWVELIPAVSRIEPMNGGGAFTVYLKKKIG